MARLIFSFLFVACALLGAVYGYAMLTDDAQLQADIVQFFEHLRQTWDHWVQSVQENIQRKTDFIKQWTGGVSGINLQKVVNTVKNAEGQ
jgi:hypothetical protein